MGLRGVFCDRRSLPLVGFIGALVAATCLIARSGGAAADDAARHELPAVAASADPAPPTFRLDSPWKLGATSWACDEETAGEPAAAPTPDDPEQAALAAKFEGLDLGMVER